MGFTEEEYNKMIANLKKGSRVDSPILEKTTSTKTRSTKGIKQKDDMEFVIKDLFPAYVKEYKFCDTRRFKFDYYIPVLKVGIEYDGLNSEKSRHTTLTGFSKDCEKTNLAQILGYKVLRYTSLNYKDLGRDLQTILDTKA